jgi:peptidylprolyl isomerase
MIAMRAGLAPCVAAVLLAACTVAPTARTAGGATQADVLTAAKPSDWREPDPESTLYLELPSGRVVMELAPDYAPLAVANLRALVREHYFDGLKVVRVQDNYVVQWGDPEGKRPIAPAAERLPPEFTRRSTRDLAFTPLAGRDAYAAEVGHSEGFPVARDPRAGTTWLVHCYGMVGVGRDNDPASGSGVELYAVIGHAPRHLDRNMTVVGRVLVGMERLAALPRGDGPMGFYNEGEPMTGIERVRLAADVPMPERSRLEVLRTDTATFAALVEARRNRREPFFLVPSGAIDLCNVPVPVRPVPP